jgi:hypothetical protein
MCLSLGGAHDMLAMKLPDPKLLPTEWEPVMKDIFEGKTENLKVFLKSAIWQEHQYKSYTLELFFQNAITYRHVDIAQLLFDSGFSLRIRDRAKNPGNFEGFYNRAEPPRYYFGRDYGTIFHRTISQDEAIQPQAIFKFLIKRAIQEEIAPEMKNTAINTLSLCIFHQNDIEKKLFFPKDLRNLLRKYLLLTPASEFIFANLESSKKNKEIVKKGCKQICPILKKILTYERWGKTPYEAVISIWRHRYDLIPCVYPSWRNRMIGCSLTPAEAELIELLDPEKIESTVEQIGYELYPELQPLGCIVWIQKGLMQVWGNSK